jgi:hypothetical protein
MKKEKLYDITIKRGGKVCKDIKKDRITEIVEEVGYWRKANAIHNWMVENVQDGNDDCGEYYVDEEDMKELIGIIDRVLSNDERGEDVLPTTSGFFFGNTDYDEGYIEDLKYTRDILKQAIKEGGSYYYSSSW